MNPRRRGIHSLLLRHDPSNDLLPAAVGDNMSHAALMKTLFRHDITEEDLLRSYETAVGREQSSWSAMARDIGNDECKTINNNGTTLRRMFCAAGYELTAV